MAGLRVFTLFYVSSWVNCAILRSPQEKPSLTSSFLESSGRNLPGHAEHGHHGHAETPPDKPEKDHHDHPIITEAEDHHGHGGHEAHAEDAHHDAHEHSAGAEHGHETPECNSSANSVAVGLLSSVVIVPLVVYMSMSKAAHGAVSDLTFRMIDLSISIFLAVLWFSASADILASDKIYELFPHAEEVFAVSQVIILYAVAMVVAYLWRDNKYYLLTFSGCAAHYIAFAGIRAVGETQHAAGTMVDKDNRVYVSFMYCMAVFLVFALISLIAFMAWRRHVKNDEMQLAVEELENDIVGLVLSYAIIQALRHALTGRYPPQAHLFLQDEIARSDLDLFGSRPHHHPKTHTMQERMFMLLWSFVFLLISLVSLNKLEELKERCEVGSGYFMHKVLHVTQVVLVMCVAWGFLLWGEWEFYEVMFHGDPMFGKMVFALMSTLIVLGIVYGLALATDSRFSHAKGYANLCVMAASLVAAWSWEHCFHTAINVVSEEYQVGYGGLVPKIIIAFVIPMVILPGYVIFLKPIVVEIDERNNQEERENVIQHVRTVRPNKTSDDMEVEAAKEEDDSEEDTRVATVS